MRLKYLLAVASLFVALSCDKSEGGEALPVETVTVNGSGYQMRTLTEGGDYIADRAYKITGIQKYFLGFDMLSSGNKTHNGGTITPLNDGFVYIIAPTGTYDGWTAVSNTALNAPVFKYTTSTEEVKLTIYTKRAYAGRPVQIPRLEGNFSCATPIARKIIYKDEAIEIEGTLVDIRMAKSGAEVYPQNRALLFGSPLPEAIDGMKYATTPLDNSAMTKVVCPVTTSLLIATQSTTLTGGWVATQESFTVSAKTYHLYRYAYTTPGKPITIPAAESGAEPVLLFGKNLKIAYEPDATIITKVVEIRESMITNPSIEVLPNGEYLASCTGAFNYSGETKGVTIFASSDKGKTWSVRTRNNGSMSYQNLFAHQGALYLLGSDAPHGNLIIRKSTDNGATWTYPTTSANGILLSGTFHCAPTPTIVHDGRLWRAFEYEDPAQGKMAFMISAPVDADLLDSSNWTATNRVSASSLAGNDKGVAFVQWLEGNAVVTPDGKMVNIMRLDELLQDKYAAMLRLNAEGVLEFDVTKDLIEFPGGAKKFTIRHDAKSGKYWTIANPAKSEDIGRTNSDLFKNGINATLVRNRMVLMSSTDLRSWTKVKTIIENDDPFFHGFQYVDWQFDGNDIVAVSRTAMPEQRGLPVRQHDANMLTFHKVANFRTL